MISASLAYHTIRTTNDFAVTLFSISTVDDKRNVKMVKCIHTAY